MKIVLKKISVSLNPLFPKLHMLRRLFLSTLSYVRESTMVFGQAKDGFGRLILSGFTRGLTPAPTRKSRWLSLGIEPLRTSCAKTCVTIPTRPQFTTFKMSIVLLKYIIIELGIIIYKSIYIIDVYFSKFCGDSTNHSWRFGFSVVVYSHFYSRFNYLYKNKI